jgi:transposase-like protein
MPRRNRYAPEVRERAVRMVFDHEDEYETQWKAIVSIADKIGCSSETLRNWVRQAERDAGLRAGLTSRASVGEVAEMMPSVSPSQFAATSTLGRCLLALADSVQGDAVNTASRMESHGVPGRIQISEATRICSATNSYAHRVVRST